ncbi:unnamed protein product [Amoebophrya sp. A120]|nr:unnamed protein product [Amoebophrya sp. A120]|eukprot:GSA120T00018930001.1
MSLLPCMPGDAVNRVLQLHFRCALRTRFGLSLRRPGSKSFRTLSCAFPRQASCACLYTHL